MNAVVRPKAIAPKEKEERPVSACKAFWLSAHSYGLVVVRGFSPMSAKELRAYNGYAHVKDIKSTTSALVAITAAYQTEAEAALPALGYKEVLRFRGNGDSALKLWIKDREGDTFAEAGPEIPDIKLSNTTNLCWDNSSYSGFPHCCGAYTVVFKGTANTTRPRDEDGVVGGYASGNLELSSVRCDDPHLGDFIYGGFLPVYKYSTEKGELRYIIANRPNIGSGAQMLVKGALVDVQEAIDAFRKKAYKKD